MRRMGSSRVVWVPGLVLAVACMVGIPWLAGACGGGAFTAGATDGGADGPTVDGPGTEGSADGSDDGADGDGGPGNIIYVSNTQGDDANTGRDRAHPKKTIVSALKAATTGFEIDVCAGTYGESQLILDADVRLKGSYDCTAWTRTNGYGFPTFDGTNTTTITNGDVGTQHATLAVVGSAVTHAALVDGFVIQGATTNSEVTYGVDVQASSSPVITNDVIGGGGGSTGVGPFGSIGVRIGGSSSAELASCVVGGGTGTGAVGSTGILLSSSGIPNVHDDVVSGGTGTTSGTMPSIGAVGVYVASSLDSSKPLQTLLISASDKSPGASGSTAGVLIAGSSVNAGVVGCEIQGGTGSGSSAISVGVDVETTGTVVLAADRIFGGQRTASPSQTFGVAVASAAGLTIENSEIHAGTVPAALNSYAVGVVIASTNAPQLLFDTIYTGGAAGTAVSLGTGVTAARITDDILLGSDSSLSTIGIGATSCTGTLASIDHTGFANLSTVYTCGSPAVSVLDVGALMTSLPSMATKDVEVESTTLCSGATWCAKDNECPSPMVTPCMQSLFGTTWSGSDDGLGGLFFAPAADGGTMAGGWALQPAAPCPLTKGGAAVTGITQDIFGTTRSTSTPTMGAVEYTSLTPCTP